VGPDTPAGQEITRKTYQTDIAPTVGELYGFKTPYSRGQVLREAISGYSDPDRLIRKQPAVEVYGDMVFVTWSDNRTGNDEVYFISSMDNGQTFGDTIQLSQSGVAAIQPDVDADNSGLNVIWIDNRSGVWGCYFRRSTDYGATWEDERLLLSNIPESETRVRAIMMWDPVVFSEQGRTMVAINAHRYWVASTTTTNGGNSWSLGVVESRSFFPTNLSVCSQALDMGFSWSDQSQGLYAMANWEIFYNSVPRSGNGRSGSNRLTTNTSYSIQPSLDSNRGSNLGLAWADNLDSSFQLFFRQSVDGGSFWYDAETVTNSPTGAWQPIISWNRMDSSYHLIWTDYRDGHGEIYHSLYDGKTWTGASRMTTTSSSINRPDFTINENGDSFVVWEVVTDDEVSIGMGDLLNP
jgi:hypothetical protein